jgi:Zn-dependent M28 family amino/carboxypeptidase
LLALLAALAALGCAERAIPLPGSRSVEIRFDAREALLAQLSPVPQPDAERKDRLVELFRLAGCEALEERRSGTELPNVLCTLPGSTDRSIVVGAHYDRRRFGESAADNWSGVVLLPNLYRALRVAPREHSFSFVGFAEAERRRNGTGRELPPASRNYLRSLAPQELQRIVAMVNLKGLGLGDTAIWAERADPNLALDLRSVANSLGLPLREIDFRNHIQADMHSFRRYGIPTILIHSFDLESGVVLSQPQRDHLEGIQADRYFDSYRLVSVYLAYLDLTLAARREIAAGP